MFPNINALRAGNDAGTSVNNRERSLSAGASLEKREIARSRGMLTASIDCSTSTVGPTDQRSSSQVRAPLSLMIPSSLLSSAETRPAKRMGAPKDRGSNA